MCTTLTPSSTFCLERSDDGLIFAEAQKTMGQAQAVQCVLDPIFCAYVQQGLLENEDNLPKD